MLNLASISLHSTPTVHSLRSRPASDASAKMARHFSKRLPPSSIQSIVADTAFTPPLAPMPRRLTCRMRGVASASCLTAREWNMRSTPRAPVSMRKRAPCSGHCLKRTCTCGTRAIMRSGCHSRRSASGSRSSSTSRGLKMPIQQSPPFLPETPALSRAGISIMARLKTSKPMMPATSLLSTMPSQSVPICMKSGSLSSRGPSWKSFACRKWDSTRPPTPATCSSPKASSRSASAACLVITMPLAPVSSRNSPHSRPLMVGRTSRWPPGVHRALM
mmetsp:Transcript_9400/g.34480  ORF Transcript_9400/g.34480 Transcript_9400/m.34480 type:complete len:275 (-) Transcript_9400:950-1774(-)